MHRHHHLPEFSLLPIKVYGYDHLVVLLQGPAVLVHQAARVEDALTKIRFGGRFYITQASYHTIVDAYKESTRQYYWKGGLCDKDLNRRLSFYRFQAMAPFWQSHVAAVTMV